MRSVALLLVFTLYAAPALGLYDPKPIAELQDAAGDWKGTLTYNDYSQPGKLVTLKTRAVISMIQPNEISLFFVFDDGPGKTVYSYERMQFDVAKSEVQWTSGVTKKETTVSHIVSSEQTASGLRIVFDSHSGDGRDVHTLTITPSTFVLRKDEVGVNGHATMRDEYRFDRSGGYVGKPDRVPDDAAMRAIMPQGRQNLILRTKCDPIFWI